MNVAETIDRSVINKKFFFDTVRGSLFGGSLRKKQVEGLEAFLDYWQDNYADSDERWLAYILATAHHEVNRTFQPIKEYGGNAYFFKMYDIEGQRPDVAKDLGNLAKGDGVLFHGRGFVQLTGRANYAYWQNRLGVDLTSGQPAADRVLDLDIATQIIFEGMILGSFTGRKLSDYFVGVKEDWRRARQIVNRMDKADNIATYAQSYYSAISHLRLV